MQKDDFDYIAHLQTSFLKEDPSLFRFGSIGDGGYYLRPKTIKKSRILFSGGISSNVEFEYDVFRFNEQIEILMLDPTVSSSKLLLKGLGRLFFKKPDKLRYLFNTLMFGYLNRSKRCIHKRIFLDKQESLIQLTKTYFHKSENILLKLDIEGSEYDFLNEIQNNLGAFSAMVFEFHELPKKHQMLLDFVEQCSPQFQLVHLSVNPAGGFDLYKRPKNIEITLERRMP